MQKLVHFGDCKTFTVNKSMVRVRSMACFAKNGQFSVESGLNLPFLCRSLDNAVYFGGCKTSLVDMSTVVLRSMVCFIKDG